MSTQRNEKPVMQQVYEVISSDQFKGDIGRLLPPGIPVDRFTQTTIVAIQHNPDVLNADRQSLYNAISRAATDGLLPDGKEGALVIYNQKDQRGNFYKVVRWMPMVEGIIKMLGKANISAYAASVYSNDTLEIWNDDDGQHVKHKPVVFSDRGEMIGTFACAKVGTRTYVEALNMDEVSKIASVSRSKDKNGNPVGPWKEWPDRMAQKSALHRLKKRLPIIDSSVSDALRDPEEDPEIVAPEDVPQLPPPDAPVSEAPARRRPRALQSVIDKTVDLTPEPVEAPPPSANSAEEDVF